MIDLRSDTVTRPTAAMRQAMATALVGDDVYGDDPTVNELEALAARVTGKEAALFVCSGTMGNQLAIMSHTRPGEELIAAKDSHVLVHECGGHARLSGLSAAACQEERGVSAQAVRRLVRDREDIHNPITSLLCLENALGDGTVVPLLEMQAAADAAHELGLKVHLDGARLFHAAVALGVDAKAVAAPADSVMLVQGAVRPGGQHAVRQCGVYQKGTAQPQGAGGRSKAGRGAGGLRAVVASADDRPLKGGPRQGQMAGGGAFLHPRHSGG